MVTEAELENMSPTEIAELQKKNCIFCHIVSGKVQSKKIYDDKVCIGILDINPANPGHVLLLPKEHYSIMPQIDEEDLGHLFIASKKISQSALKAFEASGTNIFVANGIAAGQKAQHFMIHIIPRRENDNLTCFDLPKKQMNKDDYLTIQRKIVNAVNQKFDMNQDLLIEEQMDKKPEIPKAEKKEVIVEDDDTSEEKLEEELKEFLADTPDEKEKKTIEKKNENVNLDDISELMK